MSEMSKSQKFFFQSRTVPVLDYGYVEGVDYWGSDEAIIEAARMSTGKGFLGWGPKDEKQCPKCLGDGDGLGGMPCPVCNGEGKVRTPGDEKLLAYLYNNKHMTPFEMAGMVIEVKAPIFVFREWHRHRTQSYNEMSARYIPIPDEHYVPSVDRLGFLGRKAGNKQSDAKTLSIEECMDAQTKIEASYRAMQQKYKELLDAGFPKELARLVIPVGRYSKMRASANLRNWLAFLTLRMDEGAQWEIREYANAVGLLIKTLFPRTWALFEESGKQ